ncbi:MAG: hypothetical protein H6557_31105 [Lewinellaceae bacterium]|nr:hypothetical protein [Phaeodactylibacter sp.]MCB9041100.1 hypothetical protein [Lewinellaceae bacterium]
MKINILQQNKRGLQLARCAKHRKGTILQVETVTRIDDYCSGFDEGGCRDMALKLLLPVVGY